MRKQLIVATAILLTSGLAHADRNKFVLAGGLGFGTNSVNIESGSSETELDADASLVSSIKIGGVVNQQHAIYYHRQASWFSGTNAAGNSYSAVSGIMGLGYTYYLKPTVGSAYVEATVGLGDFIDVDASDVYRGRAVLIGAGYELNKHVQVGATFERSATEDDDSDLIIYHNSIAAKVEFKL